MKKSQSIGEACFHCGLALGNHPVGDDPYFCCRGCESVSLILTQSGLAETFYRLRDQTSDPRLAAPSSVNSNPVLLSELDTDEFADEHTELLSGGYRRVRLYLDGVHCAACVWLVERLPKEHAGVRAARLDLPRSAVTLEWDPETTKLSTLAGWLARIGYPVQPRVQSGRSERTEAEKRLLVRVGICWALAGNVMLIAFALYSGLESSSNPVLHQSARWLSLALAIPSVLIGGTHFFRRAWISIRIAWADRSIKHLHMDTPISAGILVGFGYSAYATVQGTGQIWFDSITVLIAALLTARWLQLRAQRLASDETDRLLALVPTMARTRSDDGHENLVRADTLSNGSIIEVRAGEVVPVDGVLSSGRSYLNNAILTGESLPERVEPGSYVYAGTTNVSSTVFVSVTATSDHTRIGQLLSWLTDESGTPSAVSQLADRIGGYFVAAVMILAIATLAIWSMIAPGEALEHVVALLVITCPCALGMATPLAFAVATGRAARLGIFVKQDHSFETLSRVNTVVLDKTGTITEGKMAVTETSGDMHAIRLAGILERESNHPIGKAIADYVHLNGDSHVVSDFELEIGNGVSGIVDGRTVHAGSIDWISGLFNTSDSELVAADAAFAEAGRSPVAIAVDHELRSIVSISDDVRPFARELIDTLHGDGKQIILCSGDHETTVSHVAAQLGLAPANVFARYTPTEKQTLIEQLKTDGRITAMIGDGVNDAAALQESDVGIAVTGSSMAGQLAANVFLSHGGTRAIERLFAGAENVMQVVRRNLWFSLGYNSVGAALAIGGFVTPLFAAIAMPLSSFVVVLSSIGQSSFSRKLGRFKTHETD